MTNKNLMNDIFSTAQASQFADTLKALGHPVRLRIVDILSKGALSVTEISEQLGQHQAIVSQQLKILRLSGLVKVERAQGKAFYSILVPSLVNLLQCLRSCETHMV